MGTDLQRARNQLGELLRKNDGKFDFAAERRAKKEAAHKPRDFTLGQWWEHYLAKISSTLGKCPETLKREKQSWVALKDYFEDMPLAAIKLTSIQQYRATRDQVTDTTVNIELALLRYLLNLAAEERLIEVVPHIRLKKDASEPREGKITEDQYQELLKHMNRENQRYFIALWETAMRGGEPRKLTWEKIDWKAGSIRWAAEDVKEKQKRRTPISFELRQVLEELREEQRKVPNIGGYVFTRQDAGKVISSVRAAWVTARNKAKLVDVRPHDFRAMAISRWTAAGIPRDIVMAASGHADTGVHDSYLRFTDAQLVKAFAQAGLLTAPENREQADGRLFKKALK